jgi:predicted protein tyrosine phosphatase
MMRLAGQVQYRWSRLNSNVRPRNMVRALFICSQNRLRSPTAEEVFSRYPGVECQSAGVHDSANTPLDPELIEWAEIIFVMENAHRNKVAKKFKTHLKGKRLIVLGIPDEYEFMDPTLVRLLQARAGPLLARYAPT